MTDYETVLEDLRNARKGDTVTIPHGFVGSGSLAGARAGDVAKNDGSGDNIPWGLQRGDVILRYLSPDHLADAGLSLDRPTPSPKLDVNALAREVTEYLRDSTRVDWKARGEHVANLVAEKLGIDGVLDLRNACVIEGIDEEGDKRTLVRSFGGGRWVTDVATRWDEDRVRSRLTDIKVLVEKDA